MDHFESIKPIVTLCRWFGIAGFYAKPKTEKPREYYTKSHTVLFTVFVSVIVIVGRIAKIYYDYEPPTETDPSVRSCFLLDLVDGATLFETYFGYFIVIVVLASSYKDRNVIISQYELLEEIDSTLKSFDYDVPFRKIRNYSCITTAILICAQLVTVVTTISFDESILILVFEILDVIPAIIYSLSLGIFINFMFSLKYRFKALNELLIQNLNRHLMGTREQNVLNGQQLDVLTKTHEKICDVCDSVNDCFGLILLSVCSYLFVLTVLELFVGARMIVLGNVYDIPLFLVLASTLIYLSIIFSLRLILVVFSTEYVIGEASKTHAFVHKSINCYDDPEIRNKLTIFLMQLINRKPTFSACGLFEINLPLLFSMVGALFTYVIILIQFDQSDQGCIDKHVETKYNGTADEHHENLTRAIYEILNDVRNNFTVAIHPTVTEAYDYVTVNVTNPALTTLSNITNATLNSLTQSNLTAPLTDAFSALSELITQKIKNHSDPDSLRNITSDIRKLLSKN